jgi:hypothetical protein
MKINLEENCKESYRHQNQRKFSVFSEVSTSTVVLVRVLVLVLVLVVVVLVVAAVEEEFRAEHYPDYQNCSMSKENNFFCENFRFLNALKNTNIYQIQDLIAMTKDYPKFLTAHLRISKLIAFCYNLLTICTS